MNTAVLFVPQQEAWVVERMGKFYRILNPGLNFLIPVIDKIKYVQSLKEIAIDVPKQSAITLGECLRKFCCRQCCDTLSGTFWESNKTVVAGGDGTTQ